MKNQNGLEPDTKEKHEDCHHRITGKKIKGDRKQKARQPKPEKKIKKQDRTSSLELQHMP
jgi:hypothetical protein